MTSFSCFPKKRKQKKGTLLPVFLRFAPGNLRYSPQPGQPQIRLHSAGSNSASGFFRLGLCGSARLKGEKHQAEICGCFPNIFFHRFPESHLLANRFLEPLHPLVYQRVHCNNQRTVIYSPLTKYHHAPRILVHLGLHLHKAAKNSSSLYMKQKPEPQTYPVVFEYQ